jgi:hypothetical protein
MFHCLHAVVAEREEEEEERRGVYLALRELAA